ncbi:MAG: preprotein translocase subunit SecE [Oscillospiraceae bacterium]
MADKQNAKPSLFARMGKYFRDTAGEFKKIVWPSKKQIVKNTLVVLTMCVAFAVVIWSLDYLLAFLRDLLIKAF